MAKRVDNKSDKKRRKLNVETPPPGTQDDEDKFMRLKEHLLPGIPNKITLEHIIIKVSWRCLRNLSLVNVTWRQAFQDRLVYNARVRHHSTENVYVSFQPHALDKVSYGLPPIPHIEGGFPSGGNMVTLDGKVYCMGGCKSCTLRTRTLPFATNEVYVLDLAGQGNWKMCAPMKFARYFFNCGVKDGRIHVFGGCYSQEAALTAEEYDPNLNAWGSMPISSNRWHGCENQRQIDI